jgi:hypothetical protein
MSAATPAPPPLDDELMRLLKRMRLPYIRNAAPELLATAKAQRWEPAEVLKALLAEEVSGRDRSALATRRARAGFPTGKTFAAWDPALSSIPAPTQDALRTLEWIHRRENLVVCGPSGTGKTFLLEALGQHAVQAGHHVAWFSLEQLGALVRRHRADDTVTKAIGKILRADLARLTILACYRSVPTPPKASTASSTPPTRNAQSRCRAICIPQDSTSSCPRHWPPPPSTGYCTMPTSAKPAATVCGSPKPWPARG